MPRLGPMLLLVPLALPAGCAQVSAVRNPLDVDRREYPRLFQAAVLELRQQGFVVDRQDYRFGRITAFPRSSPTMLEPWYDDNTTFAQAVQSTLNAERRLVAVTLEPVQGSDKGAPAPGPGAPAPGASGWSAAQAAAREAPPGPATPPADTGPRTYLLRIEVQVERQQHPEQHLTGTTRSTVLLGAVAATPGELVERGITGPYWQPVGRDPWLEDRLLTAIVRRSLTVATPPDADLPPDLPAALER